MTKLTDREMLELAAKTAGYKIKRFREEDQCLIVYEGSDKSLIIEWNPIVNKSQAFDLADKCFMNVDFDRGVVTKIDDDYIFCELVPEQHPDMACAIVACAAEMRRVNDWKTV